MANVVTRNRNRRNRNRRDPERTVRFGALALLAILVCAALFAGTAHAQSAGDDPDGAERFSKASSSAQQDLQQALAELSQLRERIAEQKLPLSREVRKLENQLLELRQEYQSVGRTLDSRNLDLNNLQKELKARQDEKSYLQNLLDEYARNFEPALHISELQSYREEIDRARSAPENDDLTISEVFERQTALVNQSLDRIEDLLGGTKLEGRAVDGEGNVREGTFALFGPVAAFRSEDGASVGIAEQKLGSLEPNVVPVDDPKLAQGLVRLVKTGSGELPFDPTLGNAQKIEKTEETLAEHIAKGGPVMVPILGMALAALVVAMIKWIQIARIRTPSRRRINRVLEAIKRRDYDAANAELEAIKGPAGEMLRVGIDHVNEPKDLVEEVMFEKLLETRLKLQGFLPFVAITASAAPLLGLLGTVTGMISTFKLISVFGAGDAQSLSSGISEALVTTEFGLIVAIPSLLLYAYLSRKARGLVDSMEKTAISFVNRLSTGGQAPAAEAAAPSES
jgi:biopolymer transport protein ExbB